MANDVTMPRLSDSMEEGTVLKWLVDVGDEVKRGEPLVEIETDKANMTYDADADGVLTEVLAQEGDTLAIGEVIARIGDAGEVKENGDEPSGDAAEEDGAEAEAEGDEAEGKDEETEGESDKAAAEAESDGDEADDDAEAADAGETRGAAGGDGGGGETVAGTEAESKENGGGTATREREDSGAADGAGGNGDGRVKASPVARRMARELGVELARLEGSGPGGRIVKADVTAAAENGGAESQTETGAAEEAETEAPAKGEDGKDDGDKAAAAPEPQRGEAGPKGEAEIHELSRLQQTVSRRMAESKATAPDFSISLTVDMTDAVALRARLKEVADPAPSFNDMVVKAAATALKEFPRVNGAYRDGKFELYENVNIGVAVAAQDALVVPTVFNADQKSLGQISKDARAVIERVRDKKVTPPELSGGTFTVSNLGMFGIEHFTAIINPPQASILTVGALAKKPAVDESGRIVARDQMTLSLVCDHRILYGADGAQFLARVKELLEKPLSLAL